jgi:hypothetical protein
MKNIKTLDEPINYVACCTDGCGWEGKMDDLVPERVNIEGTEWIYGHCPNCNNIIIG